MTEDVLAVAERVDSLEDRVARLEAALAAERAARLEFIDLLAEARGARTRRHNDTPHVDPSRPLGDETDTHATDPTRPNS